MSNDRLLRDIFKIQLNDIVHECYRTLGYNYMYMYSLHIKYDALRLSRVILHIIGKSNTSNH